MPTAYFYDGRMKPAKRVKHPPKPPRNPFIAAFIATKARR
jgi:hypothetical protein